jgi:hypothetical protein
MVGRVENFNFNQHVIQMVNLLGRVGVAFIERRLSLLILFTIFYTECRQMMSRRKERKCFAANDINDQ